MAINITFTGNIVDNNEVQYINDEVKYQLYFYKQNTGSSSSIWSSTRLSELGQYNINLGDSDIVTQEGTVNIGDKVIIAFWTPNTSLKTDNDLVTWGFIEKTLTSSTEYINDVKLMGCLPPIPSFNVTGSSNINENVYVTDIGCHDIQSWVYNGVTIYQEPTRYSQPIFYSMNTLPTSAIDINWGDGQFTYKQTPALSYSHQYSSPSIYDITCYVTNECGLSASQILMQSIYYNTPVVNFVIDNITPNPIGKTGIGETVTFTNTTSDPNNRSDIDGWYCDWYIEDGLYTVSLSGQSFDYSPTHQFHSAGEHDVTLTLHWYNGYEWLQSTKTLTVDQQTWSVTNGLTWQQPVYINTSILFTPSISGNVQYINSITYFIDGTPYFNGLTVNDTFNFTFHVSTTHYVNQTIFYHNGFENVIQQQVYNILMSSIADFIQSDDLCGDMYTSTSVAGKPPITMYTWTVYLNNLEVATLSGPYRNIFEYNWPTTGTYKILHSITDSDGNVATIVKTYPVTSCKFDAGSYSMPYGGQSLTQPSMPTVNATLSGQANGSDLISVNVALNSVTSVK
jgi:hypothetical protein